ncbi:Outer membrane protein beta-barrel domain-containing protein [Hymenobacter psychrophilus]|uniref:Outer membrane protein beta-barrel domain-containing protein n=1 Tax=Hymenobacter psychrophilus TaxID=651662 RepID=A0A1H3JI50_9BACT|nr:Outer membrane protein beta-barrel domain-containing protein [Hymenobacter psychrophilus]
MPLLAAALLASSAAQAQTAQGTRVLGLSGGNFTFQSNDNIKRFSGTLMPSLGIFVADNLAVGVAVPLGYSRLKLDVADGITNRSLTLGVLPWLRYYLPSESKHQVFGELSVGGVLSSYRSNNGIPGESYFDTDVHFAGSAGLGYSYFITPAVGLEGLLAYQRITGNSNSGNGALSLNLGFRIYLPRN